ncbi:unnamed protein product [Lepeophtheirus salmonis]|uniref:(salmon louse) hypothetical protein n=1 Tax=Lepeophtheirus salmonis TaxID=72036 RepID=A0A7R8H7J0_LEPSM|nr:unnamed protein product [Lepeophtheirus salmonis]CAF2919484.1 unnamed protein product [Lepeophtheirus salmonis]
MSTTTMLNISEEAYICSGATAEEIQHFTRIDWWIQGLLQLIICIIGLTGNTVCHSNFMLQRTGFCFLPSPSWRSKFVVPWSKFHHSVFHAHVLYPIHNIVLCCSAYMTAGIAFERYFAVYRPIEYYNRIINNGRSPWFRSIFNYTIPVLLFCTFVNIPKFFELNAVLNGSNEETEPQSSIAEVPQLPLCALEWEKTTGHHFSPNHLLRNLKKTICTTVLEYQFGSSLQPQFRTSFLRSTAPLTFLFTASCPACLEIEQNSSITYYSQNSFKKKESIQAQNVQVDEGLEESKMEQTPSKSRNVLIPLTENILPLYEETKNR